MIVVSVMYSPEARFDEAYYLDTHMPLVRARFAGQMTDARVLKGQSAPGGGAAAYQIITELSFPSMVEVGQALGGPHAAEVMADVANFTTAQPILQISEVIG
jgi:uncharacterized protein (TIGR02118 family)